MHQDYVVINKLVTEHYEVITGNNFGVRAANPVLKVIIAGVKIKDKPNEVVKN